jgi:hypothetical protein
MNVDIGNAAEQFLFLGLLVSNFRYCVFVSLSIYKSEASRFTIVLSNELSKRRVVQLAGFLLTEKRHKFTIFTDSLCFIRRKIKATLYLYR